MSQGLSALWGSRSAAVTQAARSSDSLHHRGSVGPGGCLPPLLWAWPQSPAAAVTPCGGAPGPHVSAQLQPPSPALPPGPGARASLALLTGRGETRGHSHSGSRSSRSCPLMRDDSAFICLQIRLQMDTQPSSLGSGASTERFCKVAARTFTAQS